MTVARRLCAEALGTAFLLAAVVGSGIMGERLANGNVAIALLANTIATGVALVTLILTFGPISGAHFNPAVSLCDAMLRGISWRLFAGYTSAQVIGAFAGVACAHLMFGLPPFSASQHIRYGASQAFSEFVATFGLLAVIWRSSVAAHCCAFRRGGVHHRCLLVYRINLVCKSCRHARSISYKYLCRNPTDGRSRLLQPRPCSAGWFRLCQRKHPQY